jgi:hypothetical protein
MKKLPPPITFCTFKPSGANRLSLFEEVNTATQPVKDRVICNMSVRCDAL